MKLLTIAVLVLAFIVGGVIGQRRIDRLAKATSVPGTVVGFERRSTAATSLPSSPLASSPSHRQRWPLAVRCPARVLGYATPAEALNDYLVATTT